jgi:hypothetical protein
MKPKISWRLLCASLYLASLAAHAAQAHDHAPAAQGADMQQMWRKSMARAPLSATAAFDQDGRLWLATVQDGYLYLRHSTDLGKTYSPLVAVNPQPEAIAADGENRPKIAIGPKGELYVSYTQSLDKPFSGNIRFSRSLDGGKSFSAPITVNDNLEIISHRFDSMVVNRHGEIYLVWLDKRDQQAAAQKELAYTGAAMYYAVSRNGGESFSANKKIADHACECCRIALATDIDGVPVAAWRHVYDKNTRDHAIARLDGSATLMRISHDDWEVDACPHHGPSLSIGEDGTYHAVWFTQGKKRHGLLYARSTDKGAHFSVPLSFGNEDAQAAHPYVLSIGKAVYLVWKEFDGKNTHIRLMRSTDNGVSWSAPASVAQSADATDHPLLIARKDHVFLSWNTSREGYRLIEIATEVP